MILFFGVFFVLNLLLNHQEKNNIWRQKEEYVHIYVCTSNWVMLRVKQGQDEHWRPEGYRKRGLLDSVCDCNLALCYVLLHAQDMPGQAAHDSTQTESAALNVSINAPTHLVSKSNLQNFRPMFPNRPHWLPKVSLKTKVMVSVLNVDGFHNWSEFACISLHSKRMSCF